MITKINESPYISALLIHFLLLEKLRVMTNCERAKLT